MGQMQRRAFCPRPPPRSGWTHLNSDPRKPLQTWLAPRGMPRRPSAATIDVGASDDGPVARRRVLLLAALLQLVDAPLAPTSDARGLLWPLQRHCCTACCMVPLGCFLNGKG